jgi:hypothetical protein
MPWLFVEVGVSTGLVICDRGSVLRRSPSVELLDLQSSQAVSEFAEA